MATDRECIGWLERNMPINIARTGGMVAVRAKGRECYFGQTLRAAIDRAIRGRRTSKKAPYACVHYDAES